MYVFQEKQFLLCLIQAFGSAKVVFREELKGVVPATGTVVLLSYGLGAA